MDGPMLDSVAIQYREFYDIPRLFVATYDGVNFMFDGRFDDLIDDYPDAYAVYTLPTLGPGDLAGSWEHLCDRAVRRLGTVPVSTVQFDPTFRQSVSRSVLTNVAGRLRTASAQ